MVAPVRNDDGIWGLNLSTRLSCVERTAPWLALRDRALIAAVTSPVRTRCLVKEYPSQRRFFDAILIMLSGRRRRSKV